jgi:biopolymer transport protein ExbD
VNNKKKKNKHKLSKINLILGLILLVVVFLIILLFSYAHFKVNINNNATASTVQTDFACLDVSFNQTGAINLNKNYPVTDAYALANFTPITATVTNNCSSEQVNYVLSLSSIYLKTDNYDTSYIPDSKIRVKALKQVGTNTESTLKDTRYLSELSTLDSTSKSYKYISSFYNTDSNFTNYSLKNTYQVDSSTIEANSTVTYKIYLWIDYYEGAPGRTSNEEYNNSTQGLKFKVSSAVTLNIKED